MGGAEASRSQGRHTGRPEGTRISWPRGSPARARRREAIATLQGLSERRLATPNDTLLLARLYEADGDWPKAQQRLQELIAAQGNNPDYLAAYIRALLRHGKADEAALYLTRLEKLAPGRPVLLELKARVLHAGKRDSEATSLLAEFASKDDARLVPCARLCEELGQHDAAEFPTATPSRRLPTAAPAW